MREESRYTKTKEMCRRNQCEISHEMENSETSSVTDMENRQQRKESKKKNIPPSEQAHKVTRKHVSPRLPPRIVQQLSTPPPILGRLRHRDDVPHLEIKLFVDRRRIVV
jgi:hypothetical protein